MTTLHRQDEIEYLPPTLLSLFSFCPIIFYQPPYPDTTQYLEALPCFSYCSQFLFQKKKKKKKIPKNF